MKRRKVKRKAKHKRNRWTMKEVMAECDRLQSESAVLIANYKHKIRILEDMVVQARRETCALQEHERWLAASHEYAYGSGERYGHIARLQAELDGMRQQARAPSAAWDGFLVSGSDASIQEVWRLIEIGKQPE